MVLGLAVPTWGQVPGEDARALFLKGRALQRKGGGDDPKGAVTIFKKVVELAPDSAEAHLRLSESLQEWGAADEAVAPALRATELAPRNGEAWAHLALLQHRRLQTNAALLAETKNALEKAAALLPQEVEIWARLGELCEQSKDDAGALRAWLKVGRLRPQITFAWEKAAFFAHSLSRQDGKREAVMALCAAKNPDSKHLRWLEDLAREQLQAGYLGHAEDSFRLLARHFPQEASVWENMALVQLNTSRFEEALKSLKEAERLRPSLRIALNIAFSQLNLGDLKGAEARLRQLYMETPEDKENTKLRADARVLLASSLLLQGRSKDLLEMLAKEPSPAKQGELLGLRVQARIRAQDWSGARADLRLGIEQFPKVALFIQAAYIPPKLFDEGFFFRQDSRKALEQLDLEATAGLWGEFRRWDRCLETAEQALKASPFRTVNLMLLQSNALDQLDRPVEAIAVLRQALLLDPQHPTVQNNLGYLLLEKGKELPEAARLIEASMRQEPGNGNVMDSWGWVLFRQGKFTEAEKALRKAAELSPFSPEVRRHLGEVLLKLDRPREAAEQWERALAFVFPERKELAQKLQKLQAQLARKEGNVNAVPLSDPDPDSVVRDEEDP
jgi:Flp pilus assembly protein TadD